MHTRGTEAALGVRGGTYNLCSIIYLICLASQVNVLATGASEAAICLVTLEWQTLSLCYSACAVDGHTSMYVDYSSYVAVGLCPSHLSVTAPSANFYSMHLSGTLVNGHLMHELCSIDSPLIDFLHA